MLTVMVAFEVGSTGLLRWAREIFCNFYGLIQPAFSSLFSPLPFSCEIAFCRTDQLRLTAVAVDEAEICLRL